MSSDAARPDLADDAEGSPPLARRVLGLSAIGITVGLLAGAGAGAFVAVEHRLQGLLWHELPHALGQEQAAPWLIVLLLVTGAVIVYMAEKLPGEGGKGPVMRALAITQCAPIFTPCVRVPELGDDTIRKVDRLVIHAHQHAPMNYVAGYGEEGIPAHDAIDIIKKGPAHAREVEVEHPFWLSAPDLKDLVTGKAQGRANAQVSTCFLNNIGIGLQFAAVGAAVYSEAVAKGIGRELPTDWFLESVHP